MEALVWHGNEDIRWETAGLWSRVGGDALDILTLASAYRRGSAKRDNVGLAVAAAAGITMLDLIEAQAVTSRHLWTAGDRRRYRDRSSFPQEVQRARGAARQDFRTPPDMQAAPALAIVSRGGDCAASTA